MHVQEDRGTAVAVYADHEEADAAVKALQHGGFEMRKLSIVGADYHSEEDAVGYYNTGDRMRTWGKNGAFWGGIWGLFFGAAFFIIPGLGPILVGGPLVAAIVGALEGAVVVGALGVFGAGLAGIGVPKDSVVEYETAVKAGKFLVIAHGTRAEADRAKDILAQAGLPVPAVPAALVA
jgi:hypothetical protein